MLLAALATPLWAGHAPTPGGPPPTNPPPPPPPGCGQNNGPCPCPSGSGGNTIDFWNGREFLTHTDLVLPGLVPITVRRSYDSQAQYDSALGYGWALNYFVRLYEYGDGSVILRRDCGVRRAFVLVGGAYQTPVGETGVLVKNGDGSWAYTEKSGEQLRFDSAGRLSYQVSAAGPYLQFTYDNRGKLPLIGLSPYAVDPTPKEIAREYRLLRIEEFATGGTATGRYVDLGYDDATGRLTGLSDSAGRSVAYEHDGLGNLTQVRLPENGELNYAYEDPVDPHNATTLSNSGCASCGGFAYELTYDAQDRVTAEQVGHNVMRMTYVQAFAKTIVEEDVTDENGNELFTATTTYEFNALGNPTRITDPYGHQRVLAYDANMNLAREERWENAGTLVLRYVEERTYDARGNVLTRTEAKGSPEQRVTSYTYDANNRRLTTSVPSVVNPAQNKVTRLAYDPAGNVLSLTETGLLGDGTPYSYVTTYGYDGNGRRTSIDGPRTDVTDVTTHTYAPVSGDLASVTEPGSLVTSYSNYTATGVPQTVTDPNGVATTYTYDSLGRVRTTTVARSTTSYTYTPSGRLATVTRPRGNVTTYTYDALDRLTSHRDGLGNTIEYTYNSAGDRIREDVKDPLGTLQRTLSFQYGPLHRLQRITNPDSSFTEYQYDYAGNLKSAVDPNGNMTSLTHDGLGRTLSLSQPGPAVTTYGYNLQGGLASVRDAEGRTTTYTVDDMRRVYRGVSPDTGTSTNSYDPAGNPTSRTDARGVTVTRQYDALNRPTRIDFPVDQDVVYTYDSCANGRRRLCQVQDGSGTTGYSYSAKGEVLQASRVVLGVTHPLGYDYDANGNLRTLTYPSGRVVTYTYDLADGVSAVASGTAGGSEVNVATGIVRKPFGRVAGLDYGNGLHGTVAYDQRYRVTGIQTGAVQSLSYGYDANGNILSVTDNLTSSRSRTFGYDPLDRLQSASGPWGGTLSWTYDKVGNRLTQAGVDASTYAYTAGTNRLTSVTGALNRVLGYDANGNVSSENGRSYVFNQGNRLGQVSDVGLLATYAYDAEQNRVIKTVNGSSTVFLRDLGGQILAESQGGGTTLAEYIYLDGRLLAKADSTGLGYLHADHLDTPVSMTNGAGAAVWSIDSRPFGESPSQAGSGGPNHRFAGQYFDAETGLHQNGWRDYSPAIGRYLAADPLGLRYYAPGELAMARERAGDVRLGRRVGGDPLSALRPEADLYSYAGSNPVRYLDPFGLSRTNLPPSPLPPPSPPVCPKPSPPPCQTGTCKIPLGNGMCVSRVVIRQADGTCFSAEVTIECYLLLGDPDCTSSQPPPPPSPPPSPPPPPPAVPCPGGAGPCNASN